MALSLFPILLPALVEAHSAKFWAHVDTSNPDGCWPWSGASHRKGYGMYRFQGTIQAASRVAWMLWHGKSPGRLHILHSCDNPVCCNPAHLSPGTHQKNMREAIERGRKTYKRKTSALHCGVCGEAYPTSDRICPKCRKRKNRPRKDRCSRGHLVTNENAYWTQVAGLPQASRLCSTCARENVSRRK